MASSQPEFNPLRPYHRPPSIQDQADSVLIPSSNPFSHAAAASSSSSSSSSSAAAAAAGRNTTSVAKYGIKARGMLNDLDVKDYTGDLSPSVVESVKELVDELLWKYMSVLIGQPFEAAKMILQARDQDDKAALAPAPSTPTSTPAPAEHESHPRHGRSSHQRGFSYNDHESDSEGDEPAYFAPHVVGDQTPFSNASASSRRAEESPPRSPPPPLKKPALPEQYLNLRRPDAVMDVIGQLWHKDGAWGVWKGTNASFLYTVLQSLLENWSRSFLSAIFNVPDLGVKEIDRLVDIASPYPWASLFVAAAAAVTTGLVLAPLDLVRTRLILTPVTKGQRRTIASLRALPSYCCPSSIAVPTMLHSVISPLFNLSAPVALKTNFQISSELAPTTFSIAKLFVSSTGMLIKLPIETVLRRGQLAVLSQPEYIQALEGREEHTTALETIVPPGRYYGLFGTMHHIIAEEGAREIPPRIVLTKKGKTKSTKSSQPTYKKGQGLDGLYRGWRIGWWGLVGVWMAHFVGHGGEGEF
ncbi:Mitochondrial fusion and transport protein ugo1 [Escovopsis weberi]|uniref:Mitochondrial fusion and transport protein ugo1 n=1 Tax=Escovopsis weberi TaxID=150374 RepID=A0A0M9VU14_ESCWE|nr:Mitochondrial fusion and transport protein ugo1 [Escovopsis weberi]